MVQKLIANFCDFAAKKKKNVADGLETPALAALQVEMYGNGLSEAACILSSLDSSQLMIGVDHLVKDIDPEYAKHRQERWDSRLAGLMITKSDGSGSHSI